LTFNAAQAFNFRLSGFLDADVAYAARCRSQEQREIRGARAFGKAEMLRKLPPRMSLRHEIQQERRQTAAVAMFEIEGEDDVQGAMITDRSSSRKLSRCHGDEIIEIIIDDGHALEAGSVVLDFQCRGVMPGAIKMGLKRHAHY